MFIDLIKENRSYRRFEESHRISNDFLIKLINLARLSPSSRNQQALKFMLVSSRDDCEKVFPSLAWAGYLKDWTGPKPGERPSAYIVVLGDSSLGSKFSVDMGICAQSILLGAVEEGYGGCMIASIKKEKLRRDFEIAINLEILLVIALGKPIEKVVVDTIVEGDVKYWRDDNGVHHVPKRDVNELTI